GCAAHGHQRVCRSGGGAGLCPGAGAVSAGGRHATARLHPVGAVSLLFHASGASNGAGAGSAASQAGPARSRAFLLLAAHAALGTALWVQGHLTTAREHLVPELPRLEAQQHRALAFRYGVDPEVLRLLYTAIDLWFLGYADAALQRLQAMF